METQNDPILDPAQCLNPSNFGRLLRMRREEAKLSLTALSKAAGVARTTIVNEERGFTMPSPLTIRRLAGVKSLRFTESTMNPAPKTEPLFCEAYNPMAMTNAMVLAVSWTRRIFILIPKVPAIGIRLATTNNMSTSFAQRHL